MEHQIPKLCISDDIFPARLACYDWKLEKYNNRQMQNTQNDELIDKYKQKKSFWKEMQRSLQKYRALEQQAYYSDLSSIPKQTMIRIGNSNNADHYIFFGMLQPTKNISRLLLFVIRTLPRPKRAYTLSYVNTLAHSQAYSDFKTIMETMPFEYFEHLRTIYILDVTFYDRAASFFSFGTVTSFLKNKTIEVSSLEDLSSVLSICYEDFLTFIPEKLLEELHKVKPQRTKPTIAKIQLIRPAKKSCVDRQQMDLPLRVNRSEEKLSSRETKMKLAKPPSLQIGEYQTGQINIPRILELLLYYFNDRPQALKAEGLFRKSCCIDAQNQLMLLLTCKQYDALNNVDDPHLIASIIKKFLASLKTPVIPYDQYEMLMKHITEPKSQDLVIGILKSVPMPNFMIILCLFEFLKKKVLPNVQNNRMNENNLAICIAPCIMRSEKNSMRDLIDAKKIVQVTAIILQQFQKIFGTEQEQTETFRRSFKEQQRKSLKEIQNDLGIPSDQSDAGSDLESDQISSDQRQRMVYPEPGNKEVINLQLKARTVLKDLLQRQQKND